MYNITPGRKSTILLSLPQGFLRRGDKKRGPQPQSMLCVDKVDTLKSNPLTLGFDLKKLRPAAAQAFTHYDGQKPTFAGRDVFFP